MISRPLIILLALGAAAYRISTGAVLEGSGLLTMAAGLICLQLAPTRPALRKVAILCFVATAVVIGVVIFRNSQ